MPVAVIACQEVTLIARHFVEALQKRFDAIYCLDEGFRAALAETGTELRPLADLPDDDRLCAYFPRGHEWIDETFGRMIDDARARDTAAYLNKYQRGYCPLLTRDRALGERFLRHRNPIQMVAYLAGQRPGVHVSSAALDRIRPFYLDTTGEDGRRTLFYLIESGTGQNALDVREFRTTFEVLNKAFMQKQIQRLAMFSNIEGKRVLEIGASPTSPILADTLTGDYGCDYTGVNIAPFKYPERSNIHLIVEDVHKLDFRPGSFDVVFSIAVWEHIPDALPVFDKIADWLRSGGVHYGIFQSWSGQVGHHVFAPRQPAHLVPPWAHLTDSAEELHTRLIANGGTKAEAAGIVDWVHNSPEINRIPSRDFVTTILNGPLEVLYLDGRGQGLIDPRAGHIAEKHPELQAEELSCLGLEFALRKSDFDIRSWPTSLTPGDPNAQ